MITLHIGASKCGSSAIQTALSSVPSLTDTSGKHVIYAVIRKDGAVRLGNDIAPDGVRGYVSSTPVKNIIKFSREQFRHIEDALRCRDDAHLVLSQESWFLAPEPFGTILDRLDATVDVLIYVRPQPSFLNSGWWQWGAWEDKPLLAWIESRLPKTRWAHYVRLWKDIRRVRNVRVRLLPNDVVTDFFSVIHCGRPPTLRGAQVNVGLPKGILRLYQRNRILRRHKDDSELDFALSRALSIKGRAPWVLDEGVVMDILDQVREDNIALLDLLDDDCKSAMENDPAWWSVNAYSHNALEPWERQPINAEEVEALCVEMAKAIHRIMKSFNPGEPISPTVRE